MPDISIQFHATRDELMTFVGDVAQELDATIVAMRFFPFETVVISNRYACELTALGSEYERFSLSLQPPILPAIDGMDFADKNPDSLRLDIGLFDEDGLRQSWLVARTEEPLSLDAWKKASKRLKKMTQAGVTAINRQNGAMALNKSHRYSEEAKSLEDAGTPMLPSHGAKGPKMKLGDMTQVSR